MNRYAKPTLLILILVLSNLSTLMNAALFENQAIYPINVRLLKNDGTELSRFNINSNGTHPITHDDYNIIEVKGTQHTRGIQFITCIDYGGVTISLPPQTHNHKIVFWDQGVFFGRYLLCVPQPESEEEFSELSDTYDNDDDNDELDEEATGT